MAQSGNVKLKKPHEEFYRNVILLKHGDFQRINGHACLPTSIDMAKIKATAGGAQFKKGVEFSSRMPPDLVKKKLVEIFPHLENRRFSCAAVVKLDNDRRKFEFHGLPRLWDGKTIKKKIMGNSSLYILEDDREVPQQTSSITHDSFPTDVNPCTSAGSLNHEQCFTVTSPLEGKQAILYQDIAQLSVLTESLMEVDSSQQGATDCSNSGNAEPDFLDHTGTCMSTAWSLGDIGCAISLSFNEGNVPSSSADSTDFTATVTGGQMLNRSSSSEEGVFFPDVSITTSGISEGDLDFSIEDLLQNHWIHEGDVQFEVSIIPNRIPLQGGDFCRFTFNPMLPSQVLSGFAIFGHLGTVELGKFRNNSLIGDKIPAALEPGWVTVILKSQSAIKLGETKILYVDEEKEFLERVVQEPNLQQKLLGKLACSLGANPETSSGETQNSGSLGSTQPVQVLRLLVYAAAETGAQQFIEMIFSTSSGRIVFDAYKDSSQLPEVVARKHGHEETACYLQDITTRFSKEIKPCQKWSQAIDWSELLAAAKATHKQPSLVSEEENNQLESDQASDRDYFGDVDTSSSESSGPLSSDSEDDVSEVLCKENENEKHCLKESYNSLKEIGSDDQTSQHPSHRPIMPLSDQLMSVFYEGVFPVRQGNILGRHGTNKANLTEICFQSNKRVRKEVLYLQQLKHLHHPGISVLLSMCTESIPLHLSTFYERWLVRFSMNLGETATQWFTIFSCKMHLDPAKDHLSLTHADVMVEGNLVTDNYVDVMAPLQQNNHNPTDSVADGDGCPTLGDVYPLVKWKACDCPTEKCYCSGSDVWVLTCEFRPTRKILFIYVADRRDGIPPEFCFEDEDCVFLKKCWKWQRCRNNSFKFAGVKETEDCAAFLKNKSSVVARRKDVGRGYQNRTYASSSNPGFLKNNSNDGCELAFREYQKELGEYVIRILSPRQESADSGFVEEGEFPLETTARRIRSFPPYDVDWPEPYGFVEEDEFPLETTAPRIHSFPPCDVDWQEPYDYFATPDLSDVEEFSAEDLDFTWMGSRTIDKEPLMQHLQHRGRKKPKRLQEVARGRSGRKKTQHRSRNGQRDNPFVDFEDERFPFYQNAGVCHGTSAHEFPRKEDVERKSSNFISKIKKWIDKKRFPVQTPGFEYICPVTNAASADKRPSKEGGGKKSSNVFSKIKKRVLRRRISNEMTKKGGLENNSNEERIDDTSRYFYAIMTAEL